MPGVEQTGGSVASPAQTPAAVAGQAATKLPPSRFHTYLYSGSKKHVFVGLLIFSAVTCAPWFLMTSGCSLLGVSCHELDGMKYTCPICEPSLEALLPGSKHQNHADYMDAAEKARQSRLSSSSRST